MIELLIWIKKILIKKAGDKISHFTFSLFEMNCLTFIFANNTRVSLFTDLFNFLNITLNIKWVIFNILIPILIILLKIQIFSELLSMHFIEVFFGFIFYLLFLQVFLIGQVLLSLLLLVE